MSSRRRAATRWSIVFGMLTAASTISAAPAGANDVGALNIGGFDDLLLDEANAQLFVSQGLDGGPVAVTDLLGNQTAALAGTEDSRRLTLSHDGATLWVPLPRTNEIVGFDTASLAEVSRHDLGEGVCPGSIAPTTGSLLAVGHSCNRWAGSGAYGTVGVLDTATGVFSDLLPGQNAPYYQPLVASSPGSGDLIVAGDIGLSPTTLYSITTIGGDPDIVTIRPNTGSNLRGLAVSPDGGLVMQASGSPYVHNTYGMPFLEDGPSFASDNYPIGAGWSGDGRIAVGSTDVTGALTFWSASTGQVLRNFDTGQRWLDDGSLDVTDDGTSVYLVTAASSIGGPYVLERFDIDLGLSVLVGATQQVPVTDGPVLAGTVQASVQLSPLPVVVTDQAGDLVAQGETRSDGNFEFFFHPLPAGMYEYTVSFAGDELFAPASGSATFTVGYHPTIDLDGPTEAPIGDEVTFTGSVTYPDGPGDAAAISVTTDYDTIAVTPGPDGTFSFTDIAEPGVIFYRIDHAGDGATHFDGSTFATLAGVPTVATTTSLSGPASILLGDTVTLSGTVTWDGPIEEYLGWLVLYGQPLGATERNLATVQPAPDGTFSFEVSPDVAGPWRFRAAYLGAPYYVDSEGIADVDVVAPLETFITLDAGPPLRVGEQGIAQGVLRDVAGAPLADRDVWISTSDPTYGDELVRTDAAGAFAVGFVPAVAGAYQVTAQYFAEPGYLSSVGTASTTVDRWLTTTEVSSPATSSAGSTVTIAGIVTAAAGAPPVVGQATVTRTNGSASMVIGAVSVGAGGTFTFDDTIPASATGDVVYEVTFWSTGTFAGSVGSSVTTLDRSPTAMSLSVTALGKKNKGSYDLVATLDQPAGGTVVLTATPDGGATVVVATGPSPLTVRVTPDASTTYEASYGGDSAHEPSSASVTIEAGGKGGKGGGKPGR